MTATEKLRRMLDERGVEWRYKDEHTTYWYGTLDGEEWGEWTATEMGGYLHLTFSANGDVVTPEQAIAATLGSCNCSNSERTSDELLPCPFCGGEARIFTAAGESWVLCKECKAATEAHTSRQIAITAWNRRVDA